MSQQRNVNSQRQSVDEPAFAAFLAIDWADQKHDWLLLSADGRQRDRGIVQHSPEAVDAWILGLMERFAGGKIAVGIEQSRGALIYLLMKYPDLILFPIHPATVKRFRSALYPSGAKDDPLDADVEMEILLHHRDRLRPWVPDTVQTRLLQFQVENRRQLVDQRTAETNRLTDALKHYYPQALDWFDNITSPLFCDFIKHWPTLQAAKTARPETLRKFFHRHNCRSQEFIERRIEQIAHALPATDDPAIVTATVSLVKFIVQQLAAFHDHIAELDRDIYAIFRGHPDFEIFHSFPGAGEALGPRLVVAFGTRRERFNSAAEVQSFSGIAPVTERSGKKNWVHFRRACPKFLRQTFHEWAGHSIGFSVWARAYYDLKRLHGAGHQAAVRALAAKWIRIAFRCWKDRIPYDEQTYLAALRRNGSALVAQFAPTA